MNIYKWLWSKFGGRPWTYIMRDIYHEAEWLVFMASFWVGILVYHFFGIWFTLALCIAYTIGYIGGHVGWGTKWIKGQKGEQ